MTYSSAASLMEGSSSTSMIASTPDQEQLQKSIEELSAAKKAQKKMAQKLQLMAAKIEKALQSGNANEIMQAANILTSKIMIDKSNLEAGQLNVYAASMNVTSSLQNIVSDITTQYNTISSTTPTDPQQPALTAASGMIQNMTFLYNTLQSNPSWLSPTEGGSLNTALSGMLQQLGVSNPAELNPATIVSTIQSWQPTGTNSSQLSAGSQSIANFENGLNTINLALTGNSNAITFKEQNQMANVQQDLGAARGVLQSRNSLCTQMVQGQRAASG